MIRRFAAVSMAALFAFAAPAHAENDDAPPPRPPGDQAPGDQAPAAKKPPVPAEGAARAKWIQERLEQVREGQPETRRKALSMLAKHDKDGDTTTPLVQLLSANSLGTEAQIDLIRTLGIEALITAVDPLIAQFAHADARVRGNAAVSLEYIGSYTAIDGLKKQLGKEKTGSVRNHLCRALGRCGALQKPARSVLFKQLKKAKTDQDLVGPLIGLAYFEKDASVARKIEKLLAKTIVPKGIDLMAGRRRARIMGWLLSEIANAKTPRFIRSKILPRVQSNTGVSMAGIGGSEEAFYEAVARKIEGDPSAAKQVNTAVGMHDAMDVVSGDTRTSTSMGGTGISTMDDMRRGRDMTTFQPKGDRKSLSSRVRGMRR